MLRIVFRAVICAGLIAVCLVFAESPPNAPRHIYPPEGTVHGLHPRPQIGPQIGPQMSGPPLGQQAAPYELPEDFNPFLDPSPFGPTVDDFFFDIGQVHPEFAGFFYDVKEGYSVPKILVKGADPPSDPMLSPEKRMAIEALLRMHFGPTVFLPKLGYLDPSQPQLDTYDSFFSSEAVIYETSLHSFLELRDWYRSLHLKGLMNIASINSLDIDEGGNQISLGIDGSNETAEAEIIALARALLHK